MRFLIWYEDGSTYHGDPFLAPRVGVQCIVSAANNEKGWSLRHKCDYYWLRDGEWCGGDLGGFMDYMMSFDGPKYVIFGRSMLHDKAFSDLIGRACERGLS